MRRLVLVFAVPTSLLLLTALGLQGCAGDLTDVSPDASTQLDATARPDAPVGDGGSNAADGQVGDGGSNGDGGGPPDSGLPDAEAPVDPAAFAPRAMDVFCARLAQCCFPDGPAGDGGAAAFDRAKCAEVQLRSGGFRNTIRGYQAVDAGRIAYDRDFGSRCLQELAAFPCGDVSGTDALRIQQTCVRALRGTVAQGQGPCTGTIECAAGTFCDTAVDGGVCAPLRALDAGCGGQDECSYRESAQPAAFCDPNGHVCRAARGFGEPCSFSHLECDTASCGGSVCATSVDGFSPGNGSCAFYTTVDGG